MRAPRSESELEHQIVDRLMRLHQRHTLVALPDLRQLLLHPAERPEAERRAMEDQALRALEESGTIWLRTHNDPYALGARKAAGIQDPRRGLLFFAWVVR